MNHCKDCKHWVFDVGAYVAVDLVQMFAPDYSTLTEEEMKKLTGRMVRYCISPKLKFYERPLIDEAAIYDGSQYMGGMITGEEFGCVNFEAL